MCKKVDLIQAAGGRILEIKTGLCESAQGRILGVCNRRAREAIAVFSPKANAKGGRKCLERKSTAQSYF